MPVSILTIDDENTTTAALELLFRDHGYDVNTAASGREAEALLARRWFDLVFLDLRLPDADGIALLKHIKCIAPETEVVLMTAHGSLDVTIEAIKRGAFYYLEKPFTFEQILLLTERALQFQKIKTENQSHQTTRKLQGGDFGIVGSNPLLRQVRNIISTASVSVIDPLLGFGGSKLLAIATLKSPGDDWALTSDRTRVFVSMPLVNQVAVIDTTTWKVKTDLATGAKPTRVALQPDEKYLWVADENGVTVIDTSALKVTKHIATGAGEHEIAFTTDNRFAFISNGSDGSVSIIDVAKLKKLADVKTEARISSMAFSSLSKALYFTNELNGTITIVDSASHKILKTITAKPGITTLSFAPGGRWGFVANPKESVVYIFDASTNELAHEQAVGEAPDQFAFTDNFAYVRSLRSEQVTMIRLSSLEKQVETVKFPGGQNAPGSTDVFGARAAAFVPAPDPGAMLIANPADKMIYYYTEGMAAPMGDFQNYQRVPRAVKIIDRSLREESLGVYTTTARLPREGVYNVSVLLSSPRVVHCFEAVASANPAIRNEDKSALRIEYLNREAPLSAGEDYKIRFRLTDAESHKPNGKLKDVDVLVFLSPGIWQDRQRARAAGDGVYEVTVKVPEAGVYLVFVESPSQHVHYRHLPYLTLHAKDRIAVK